ncbi:MAG TPA: hypothetical protein VEF72_31290 [Mycobacterium sp.]|nr:hypothetical protein [Mycobacterium sp.]
MVFHQIQLLVCAVIASSCHGVGQLNRVRRRCRLCSGPVAIPPFAGGVGEPPVCERRPGNLSGGDR